MSRANPQASKLVNPAVAFVEFNAKEKSFYYYDKKQEKQVLLDTNKINGVVLETGYAIKGFIKDTKQFVYSNEVRLLNEDTMNIKLYSKKGGSKTIASGVYSEIKDELNKDRSIDWSLFIVIYYMTKNEEGERTIFALQLKGSAFFAWTNKDFDADMPGTGFKVSGFAEESSGSIDYFIPIFKAVKIPDEAEQAAQEMALKIKEFYDEYSKRNSSQKPFSKKETKEENTISSKNSEANSPEQDNYYSNNDLEKDFEADENFDQEEEDDILHI
ncbi:MAG TPA: hypothetical protein VKN74_02795 [Candidatus Mcinerneyibacterium sp.]|nr:hypothetical protein [Candidatus Mcinerneyibacterium sp.]